MAVTAEEERALILAAKAGDASARRQLYTNFVGYLYYLMPRYLSEDARDALLAEAFFGMDHALERFDPERGTRFSTFARHWIRAYISRARLASFGSFTQPTRPETPRRISVCIEHHDKNDQEIKAGYWVVDEKTPEDFVAEREAKHYREALLERALSRLGSREKAILHERFVENRTLQEIGDAFGLSRERIRQIESKALAKLRRYIGDAFERACIPLSEIRELWHEVDTYERARPNRFGYPA